MSAHVLDMDGIEHGTKYTKKCCGPCYPVTLMHYGVATSPCWLYPVTWPYKLLQSSLTSQHMAYQTDMNYMRPSKGPFWKRSCLLAHQKIFGIVTVGTIWHISIIIVRTLHVFCRLLDSFSGGLLLSRMWCDVSGWWIQPIPTNIFVKSENHARRIGEREEKKHDEKY